MRSISKQRRRLRNGVNSRRDVRRRPRLERLEQRQLLAADMPGVVRGGHFWYLDTDGDPTHEIDINYGLPGDMLYAAGDWNGDGRVTPAVARPDDSGGLQWFLDLDGDPQQERRFFFGLTSHTPLVGDFNGDGTTDIAAIGASLSPDPTVGLPTLTWYIAHGPFPTDTDDHVPVDETVIFGFQGDRPVVGDWDGDGNDDVGVVSQTPVNGLQRWYLHENTGINTVDFGFFGDQPVVGDWDDDGDDDVGIVVGDANRDGVADPLATWYLATDRDIWADITYEFGFPGDVFVPGRWHFPEVDVEGIYDGQGQPVDFGTVQVNTSPPTKTIKVSNTGNADLHLGTASLPTGFSLVEGLTSNLRPGQSDTFTVALDTSSVGEFSGSIRFATNDGNEDLFDFPVRGVVRPKPLPRPEIVVDGVLDGQATPIDFGSVLVGESEPQKTFTVTNTGTATLTLGTITVPEGFEVVEGLDGSLAPGASDTFTIALDTALAGNPFGDVRFTTNDSNENPFNFPVTGEVRLPGEPEIVVVGIHDGQTTPIDFGSVTRGQPGPTRNFVLKNTGDAPLSTRDLRVPAGFEIVDGLLPLIPPGGNDTIVVRLETTTSGTKSGELRFGNNDVDENPFNFPLTGRVVDGRPEITVIGVADGQRQPVDFGTGFVGSPGPIRTFEIRNDGTANLTIGDVRPPRGFRLVEQPQSLLLPNQTTSFMLQLETTSAGAKSGQVTIDNNDADENPFNFPVTGEVIEIPKIFTAAFSISHPGVTLVNSDGSRIQVDDSDIVGLTQVGDTYTFSMIFDGSDVGLDTNSEDIDGFAFSGRDIIISTKGSASVDGGVFARGSDLLIFRPSSLGERTEGSWDLLFDGRDVGLFDSSSNNIDAVAVAPDGRLLISTEGTVNVPGVRADGEDLLAFRAISWGDNTQGTWELYLDGSDISLFTSSENIVAVSTNGSRIDFSTKGLFSVPGATGDGSDVIRFAPDRLGNSTSGSYEGVILNAEDFGLEAYEIDGVQIGGLIGTREASLMVDSWRNETNPLDANGDGVVTPLDVVTIVNEINTRQMSDAATGVLTPRTIGMLGESHYDVTGDGMLNAMDALQVVNNLNESSRSAFAAPGAFAFGDRPLDQVGVFRPTTAMFQLDTGEPGYRATPGETPFQFGLHDDQPIAGNFAGDEVDEVGIFRQETDAWGNPLMYFYLDADRRGWQGLPAELEKIQLGLAGDQPLAADFNGDGFDELGVFRPGTGEFFLDRSGSFFSADCGASGRPRGFPCSPIPPSNPLRLSASDIWQFRDTFIAFAGDFDGDRRGEVGVYYVDGAGFGRFRFEGGNEVQFGLAGDRPVIGDFDGDGRDNVGVYRIDMSTGHGFLIQDHGAPGWQGSRLEEPIPFGLAGDRPVAGNWGTVVTRETGTQYGYIEMPGSRIELDFAYGGIVTQMFGRATPHNATGAVLNPLRGAALNRTIDVGNDPTQAGANGETPLPVAKLGSGDDGFYAREIDPALLGLSADTAIVIDSYAPFSWQSHEPADDYVPGLSRGDAGWTVYSQSGWATKHSKPDEPYSGFPQNLPFRVPVHFDGNPHVSSGILMPGNTQVWNAGGYEAAPIVAQHTAARVRVAFGPNTDAGAVAGIMFRKQLGNNRSPSQVEVYQADGYALNVNRAGVIELQRWRNGASEASWTVGGPEDHVRWQQQLAADSGLLLEARASEPGSDTVAVWVEGAPVLSINDALPPVFGNLALDNTGRMAPEFFGLFAQTTSGRITFSDRELFDLNLRVRSTYAATSEGFLDVRTDVIAATEPIHAYVSQLPVAFLSEEAVADSEFHRQVYDASRNLLWESVMPEDRVERILTDTPTAAAAFWMGAADGGLGLMAMPAVATVYHELGRLPTEPHAGFFWNSHGRTLAFSPLTAGAIGRTELTRIETRSFWSPMRRDFTSLLDQAVAEQATDAIDVVFGQIGSFADLP